MMQKLIKKGIQYTWKATKIGLGIVATYILLPKLYDAYIIKITEENEEKKKKSILVIPFHKIQFTDQPTSIVDSLKNPFDSDDETRTRVANMEEKIKMEVKDFVSLLHKAAEDPDIVGLYGTCGVDNGVNVSGLAQLEEIRNAIKVFRESHRRHLEPNLKYEKRDDEAKPKEKPCLFFSYSFDSFGSVNAQYYLASAFQKIAMQQRGNLNIFGISSSIPFLKSALETYGIKAHVFKHGLYKNAPNMFTENTYTPEHYDNVNNLIMSLQKNVLDGISKGRECNKAFNPELWKAIIEHGTMTALNAEEVGFIDKICKGDLLEYFTKKNKVDYLSLSEYKKQVDMKQKAQRLRNYYTKMIDAFQTWDYQTVVKEYDTQKKLLDEKIVVLNVSGSINKQSALKIISCIKKIKDDENVKSVVLRIDSPGGGAMESEVILSELNDLNKPVICSMSNVAASGGYYIASNCKKIYAQPLTITGSIGVYGIKLDMSDLAKRNGINVENVSIMPSDRDYASALSIFKPLSKEAGEVINRNIDNTYNIFKSVVSEGRQISMEEVEDLAQGKVYTGEQAKEIGLVDNCGGGINAAIEYAQSNYTATGNANVVVWPPKSFMDKLNEVARKDASNGMIMNNLNWLNPSLNVVDKSNSGYSGALLTLDETTAVQYMLQDMEYDASK